MPAGATVEPLDIGNLLEFQQNTQHPAQRLRGAPQKLVAHGKGPQVLASYIELEKVLHWYGQGAGHRRRSEFLHADLALVRYHFHPLAGRFDHPLDFIERDVLGQLDGERLTVTAHRADAHADAVHGNRFVAAPENLVGLGLPLPLLTALAAGQFLVDPRNETARERNTKEFGRIPGTANRLSHLAVNVENRRGRIVEQRLYRGMSRAHLLQQLARVVRAGAGGGLVRSEERR